MRPFPLPGHIPYRVTLAPIPSALARFARAVVLTGATFTEGERLADGAYEGTVWIRAVYLGAFRAVARPQELKLVVA